MKKKTKKSQEAVAMGIVDEIADLLDCGNGPSKSKLVILNDQLSDILSAAQNQEEYGGGSDGSISEYAWYKLHALETNINRCYSCSW